MKASLVSREVIADSIETVTFAEAMDGLIVVAACDKNMPGALMAMARLNVPSLFVYGGAILAGSFKGQDVNIQDMYEAVGTYSQGKMSLEDLLAMERVACPGEGACAGMFTANTMASAIEALGMSMPGAASVPAVDPRGQETARVAGSVLYNLLERDIKPRDILTRDAFENAISVVLAMGGSTNSVLHLLAIAHEAQVPIEIDDFDRLSRRTPYLTDLRPGWTLRHVGRGQVGRRAGGHERAPWRGSAPRRRDDGYGKSIAENLSEFHGRPDSRVIYPVSSPRSPTGGLVILKGNLAPEGAVMKVAGTKHLKHEGPAARVFDDERSRLRRGYQRSDRGRRRGRPALRGAEGGSRDAGDARRHRRDYWSGAGRQRDAHDRRALLRCYSRSDDRPRGARGGRGGSHRPGAGWRCDHPRRGSPRAEKWRCQTPSWRPVGGVEGAAARYDFGVMAKYARLVSSAARGAVTT